MRRVDRIRCATAAVVVAALAACAGPDDPEARIRATLADMEAAAESGDPGEFLESVAADFRGQEGAYDRKRLGELLRIQLLRHTRVQATVLSQEYQVYPGHAKGTITVLLTGGPRNWLPESGRLYRIDSSWVERDGDWLLRGADWDPVVGAP